MTLESPTTTNIPEIDGKSKKFWAGYNPDNKSTDYTKSVTQLDNNNNPKQNTGRWTNVIYANFQDDHHGGTIGSVAGIGTSRGFYLHDMEIYVKGDPNASNKGTIAVHTVWDGKIKNVKGFLKGYGAFISTETWHSGKLIFDNINVNIEGDNNTVFYVYPTVYNNISSTSFHAFRQRGEFSGTLNATVDTKENYIYTVLGTSGSYKIESTGTYKLNASNNMVYLGMGYSPNFENFINDGATAAEKGNIRDADNTGLTPSIQFTTPVESTGDNNTIMMFEDIYGLDSAKVPNSAVWSYIGADELNRWRKSTIGIYQGEVDVRAKIGVDAQSSVGNIGGQDASYVENNIGVLSRTGQREGIVPSIDLGASKQTGMPEYDRDKIHNLEIGHAEIHFGKYSKNGIMFAAQRGTVMDIAKTKKADRNLSATGEDYKNITVSSSINDYSGSIPISSYDDSKNNAATGTIIAYAEGTWKNSDHQMTTTSLEGKGSAINIHKDVNMSARTKGNSTAIAYMAENGGIINISKNTTTTANGIGTVVAYAKGNSANKGEIKIEGAIVAKDAGAASDNATKLYKYKNIGGFAGSYGEITISGKADIYGIGGMASGTGAIVNLNNATNMIKTGKDGALVATNGGVVNFAGGTITHSENEAGDHDTSTPMYADNTGHINFRGNTTINIANGILMSGVSTDYTATTGTATKYNGMQNVNVNLTGDGVILSSHDGHTPFHWAGGTIANVIQSEMKLNSFNDGGHSYKIYYTNGDFFIDGNINLDSTTEAFNKFGLAREKVTISPGVTVSSATGKGLALGSNKNATTNMDSGYTNKGTISVTGGTSTGTTAINTSYGHLDNQNGINMDNGIAAYGVNGSKFTNNSTGKINITNGGVGMAAFATASSGRLGYGTDDKISKGTLTSADKVLELDNKGTITVAGNQSIGLYGETNELPGGLSSLSASNGSITNTGKIIMTGDAAVGILSKRTIVNLGGIGSSDIVVGTNGIGVYAEKSPVNIMSNTGMEVKDKGVGIFIKNDGSTLSGSALEIKYTGSANNSAAGIFYEGKAGHNVTNSTDVNIVNNGSDKGIVGIFMNNGGTLTNIATITDKSGKAYGIYSEGANVINSGTLTIGNKGRGILSTGGDVTLTSSSAINLGKDEAIAVYTKGNGNKITADSGSKMTIGNGSYGFINEGSGNTITSNMTSQSVGDNTVFVFSRDTSGTVINNTPLTSSGSLNYGLADINYSSGIGNVGVYSTNGGTAVNSKGVSITVGASNSDPAANQYAIGMAAGYFGDAVTPAYTGNVVNKGTINVNGEYSIGMFGTEIGTKVINDGTINLNASNTTGMYLDNGAYGINNGIIKSNGTGLKKVVGMVVKNGSTIENNGRIEIDASEAVGLLAKGDAAGHNIGKIKNYGILKITGSGARDSQIPEEGQELEKDMAGVRIHTPAGSSTATITVNGVPVIPELATTTAQEYKPMEVSTIGMYIDTSSKRFTTPVVGLNNLTTLTNADLIIGTEAAQNTTGKYIKISREILSPYNKMILNNPQIEKWNIYSGSLTWMASVAQNQINGTIENAYLAKIPYTRWAGRKNTPVNSTDTYNFLNGLDQRYGVESLGSREKLLFDKISGIGNNEEILFYQATDEMMGHQYGNLQQRINATANLLDKEFSHLRRDWRTPTKQNNKIKTFGMRDEYKTDTAGIIDYTSNAYGVAYVHEDQKIKMGNSSGWHAGAVTNRFKFKDIGKSRENQTMLKAGVFKTMSPRKDHNGALQWTIGGDVFVGMNDMRRRYLVVDEVFEAKSSYSSYGAALKTDLGYDIRMSERTHLRPYGALKMEYGRFSGIKEKNGQVRLEVEGNDYFSVKPEVGAEFKYVQPLAVRTNLTVGLTAAYENELGKVGDVNNKGRVRYTTADWFGIRGEKDDRKGNGKFDLNIGVDNTRFGVTVNAGYDTKGKNVRGGIGFRAIY